MAELMPSFLTHCRDTTVHLFAAPFQKVMQILAGHDKHCTLVFFFFAFLISDTLKNGHAASTTSNTHNVSLCTSHEQK